MANENSEPSEIREDQELSDDEIKKITDTYQETLEKGIKIEDLDLINLFFHPLRVQLNEGKYNYELVKTVYSATKLLDTKVQNLLDRILQKKGIAKPESETPMDDHFSSILSLNRPIQPVSRPLIQTDIKRAFIELMVHRKKKRIYNVESKKMRYDPIELERISIDDNKAELLEKIRRFKKATINFAVLLQERTWPEVARILTILLHLAHEGRIKLHQDDFPTGEITISYREDKN
jgi:hypothetical protein